MLKPGGRLALSDFIPAPSLVPLLRFQDTLLGWVSDRVSGQSYSTAALSDYRTMAREAGLSILVESDITRNTLPTYPVVRHIFREIGVHVFVASAGTRVVETMCRAGLFRYFILSYQRE